MVEVPQTQSDSFCPISPLKSAMLYKRYHPLMDTEQNMHFAGRLETYQYYNMNQVVAQPLRLYLQFKHS